MSSRDTGNHLTNGISISILAITFWAYTGQSNSWLPYLVVATALGVTYWSCRGFKWISARETRKSLLVLAAASLSTQLMYVTVGMGGLLYMRLLPFTNANNDIASFVAGADNINHSGFDEFWRVRYYGIASGTKTEFTGASAIISFVSRLTTFETWRVAIPVMCLILAATVLVLVEICRVLGIRSLFLRSVLVVWALHAPLSATVQNDYFLSQGLARLLTFHQILLISRCFTDRENRGWQTVLYMALNTSALLISYSAGAGLCLVVTGIWLVASVAAARDRTMMSTRVLPIGLGWTLGFLLVIPRWSSIVENLRFFSTPNITGWPAKTMLPNILLGTGNQIAEVVPVGLVIPVCVAATLMFFAAIFRFRKEPDNFRTGVLFFFGLVFLLGSLGLRFGSMTYQTWKAWGTFQPLIIVLFIVVVHRGVQSISSLGPTAISVLIVPVMAFAVYSSQDTYRDVTVVPNAGLVKAAEDQKIKSVPNLTIRLRPYFETMIAPIVIGVHDAQFGSDTYLGPPPPPTQCMLVYEQNSDDFGPILSRYGDVVLVGDDSCLTP